MDIERSATYLSTWGTEVRPLASNPYAIAQGDRAIRNTMRAPPTPIMGESGSHRMTKESAVLFSSDAICRFMDRWIPKCTSLTKLKVDVGSSSRPLASDTGASIPAECTQRSSSRSLASDTLEMLSEGSINVSSRRTHEGIEASTSEAHVVSVILTEELRQSAKESGQSVWNEPQERVIRRWRQNQLTDQFGLPPDGVSFEDKQGVKASLYCAVQTWRLNQQIEEHAMDWRGVDTDTLFQHVVSAQLRGPSVDVGWLTKSVPSSRDLNSQVQGVLSWRSLEINTLNESTDGKNSEPTGEDEVHSIVGERIVRCKPQYLIRWKGYDSTFDTWEPREHLTGCEQLLEQWNRKHPRDRL